MTNDLIVIFIYFFGFVGLMAIGVFPWRFFNLLRDFYIKSIKSNSTSLVILICMSIILLVDFFVIKSLFECLTGKYCGPGIASGWIYLAFFGIIYTASEVLLFFYKKAMKYPI